jgi:hypothetical protein
VAVSYSLHFKRVTAYSFCQQLVTQANTKDRFTVLLHHDRPNVTNCISASSRITRTIAEKQSIKLIWVQGMIPWNNIQPYSPRQKAAQLVVFQTAVNNTYSWESFSIID